VSARKRPRVRKSASVGFARVVVEPRRCPIRQLPPSRCGSRSPAGGS
jgi:hypothetical protein